MGRWAFLAVAGTAALVLTPTPAAAQYLDPGASSIVVQLVIAGVIGFAAVLKLYWRRIKAFVASRRKPTTGTPIEPKGL